jgi:YegS/Rv2252/BmrU family lipid kinase
MAAASQSSMTDTHKKYGQQLSRQIRRFTVLYNPKAGRNVLPSRREQIGKAVTYAVRSLPDLFSWQFVETLDTDAAVQLASKAVNAHDSMVVVAGGDDTIRQVATVLSGSNTALGIIPFGTVNTIARSIGINTDLDNAVSTVLDNHFISMDMATVDGAPFVGSIAYGLDTVVPRPGKINCSRILSSIRYPYRLARQVREFVPVKLKITVDNEVYTGSPLLVTIANGEYAGNGIKASPGSTVTDGKFSVCIIDGNRDPFVSRVIPALMSGSHIGMEGVRILTGSSVVLDADIPIQTRTDGTVDTLRYFEAGLVPAALRVAVPYVPEPNY